MSKVEEEAKKKLGEKDKKPEEKKGQKMKMWVLIGVAALVVIGGVAAYILLSSNKEAENTNDL
mgnify:CR=1 FL=1